MSQSKNPELQLVLAQCHASYALVLERGNHSGKLDAIRRSIQILDQVPLADRTINHEMARLGGLRRLAEQIFSRNPEEAVTVLARLIDEADSVRRSFDRRQNDIERIQHTAHHLLGQIHRAHTGNLDLSQKHLQLAILQASKNMESPEDARKLASWLRSLGMLQRLRGEPHESLNSLRDAERLFRENQGLPEHFARIDYNLAQAYWDLGRLNTANECCLQAMESWQDAPRDSALGGRCRVFNLHGLIQYELGNLAEAEIAFRYSIDQLATATGPIRLGILADAYIHLARLLQNAGDYRGSMEACSNASKATQDLNFGSHQFRHVRALVALQMGRTSFAMGEEQAAYLCIEEAADLSHQSVVQVPEAISYQQTWLDSLHWKAKYLTAQGLKEAADELSDTVLQQRQSLARAHPNLIAMNLDHILTQLTTLQVSGPHDPSLGIAEKAAKASPQNPYCWHALAWAKYRMDLPAESLEALEVAENCFGEGRSLGHYGFLRAMCHHDLGNDAIAEEWFSKASKWTAEYQSGNERIGTIRHECIVLLSLEPGRSANRP